MARSTSGFSGTEISRGVYITKKLMDALGLKDYQACGLSGCFLGESRCDPHAVNKAEKSGKFKGSSANGAGYGAGIAQWSNNWKKVILKEFNKYSAIEYWTLDEQIQVVIKHCNTTHKKLYQALQTASNVAVATDYALRGYENSGRDQGFMRSKEGMKGYTWAKTISIPYLGVKTFSDGYVGLLTNRTACANVILKALGSTDLADLDGLGGGSSINYEQMAQAVSLIGRMESQKGQPYPVHVEYLTFAEAYSNLFSLTDSKNNMLKLNNLSDEGNEQVDVKIKTGRIYSINDPLIVLDELSLPNTYKDDEYVSKGVTDQERKIIQSTYDKINLLKKQ